MYRREEERFGLWKILSRPSRIFRPTKKRTELVWSFDETRSFKRGLRFNGGKHELPPKGIHLMLTPQELADRVAERYDPDLLVEILDLSSKQILDAFMDEFIEKREKFYDDDEHEETDEEE